MPQKLTEDERLFVAKIAVRVHDRRKSLGLDRMELARRIIGPGATYEATRMQAKRIANMEDANNGSTTIFLRKIAKALGITVASLLDEGDLPPPRTLNEVVIDLQNIVKMEAMNGLATNQRGPGPSLP